VSHDVFKNTIIVENIAGKNSQSFSHCGSFDHLDLQSRNDYTFDFFGLPTEKLGRWDLVIYRWKGFENSFPTTYYTP
jgi:hypothetical protein